MTRFNESNEFLGRRCRKRRAVSEIISILLLVAIAVSMGLVVYSFASGSPGGLAGSFAGLASNQGEAVAESFAVEQAAFTYSAGSSGASLYVRNVGTVPVTLASVYIVDQSTNAFVEQVEINQALSVGAVLDISQTSLTFVPSHGHTYSFIVTSSLGNSVTFNEMAN